MKKYINSKIVLFVIIITILLLLNHIFYQESYALLKCGAAKINITPPVGTWQAGWGNRNKPCDDIADELYAKALVFNDGNNTIAIVSTDLLWFPLDFTDQIRKIVNDKTGIPEKNVLICGTHNHFGPKVFTKIKIGPESPDDKTDLFYVQTLIKKIAGSIYIAYKNMQEAKVGAAKGEIPEVVFNQRIKRKNGLVSTINTIPDYMAVWPPIIEKRIEDSIEITVTVPSKDPDLIFGPIDPEVCILRVEDMNSEIIGSIINCVNHPVVGNTKDLFYSISADFPAVTASVVEKMEGGICLFAFGSAANMKPIKRGEKARYQIGKAIGGEALRRLQFISTTNDVVLNAIKKRINLPVKPGRFTNISYLTTEIQVLRIGDIYILGMPGEDLVEIGLEIKRKANIENLFIINVSNDALGFLCHSKAYEEGGAEPEACNLAKGSGEIAIKEALNLLEQIKIIK